MKRALFTTLLVIGVTGLTRAQNEIEGIWLTHEKNSRIEISNQGDSYQGRIVWLEQTTDRKGNPLKDRKNPDPKLRDREIMGMEMLSDLTYADGVWKGKLYGPKRGRTTDVTLRLLSEEELGVGVSVMGMTRNFTWKRVRDE